MTSPRANPVFCAIDTSSLDFARSIAAQVAPHVGGLKLGLEFFNANGPGGVRQITALELPLFPGPEAARHSQHGRRRHPLRDGAGADLHHHPFVRRPAP